MHRIRLVIADRRPIVLQGFTSLLAAQPDFEVVASCLDGSSCLEAIRNLAPDVALLEDGFSDVTASQMLAVTNAENIPTRLVFFTASVASGDVADAIASGACGSVSMSENPDTVMHSLRVAAPRFGRAPAGKEGNGASVESAPALLTVNERKVMRLVAQGLSNQAIARQLNASPGIIQVHLDHLFQKLGINNRRELAARAVSYRYGGIGALAAAIYAALDNLQPANATDADADAAHTETFAITGADGTPHVFTIVIHRQKEATSGSTIRATSKARGVANTAPTTPAPAAILAESGVDISAGTLAALNAARPSMGSHGTFMMAAAGAWIYAIDAAWNGAQASAFGDSLTDVLPSASAAGIAESAPAIPDVRAANLDGSDLRASSESATHDWAFAFRTFHGDTIATGGEGFQIIDAGAEYSAGGPGKLNAAQARTGSGSINPCETPREDPRTAAAAADKPQHTRQETADDDPNRGQSPSHAHASDNGSASANNHDDSDDNPNHGHLQRNSHGPEDGPPGRKNAKHDAAGNDPNHGHSQPNPHISGDGPPNKKPAKHDVADAATGRGQAQPNPPASDDGPPGKKNAKHDGAGDDSNHGHSQPNSHISENGPPNKKPAKHDVADAVPNQGQAQPNPPASDDGPPGKKNIKHNVADDDLNHGQSQARADDDGAPGKKNARQDVADDGHGPSQQSPNAFEDDAAGQHGKQHSADNDTGHGQSQNNLSALDDGPAAARQQASYNGMADDFDRGGAVHAPNNLQPQPGQAAVKHHTVDDAVQAETPFKLGDSFHFKNANSNASDFLEVQHEPDPIAHGRRAAGHDGPASVEDAGLTGLSPAQHDGGHHASGGQHHAPHDLLV